MVKHAGIMEYNMYKNKTNYYFTIKSGLISFQIVYVFSIPEGSGLFVQIMLFFKNFNMLN